MITIPSFSSCLFLLCWNPFGQLNTPLPFPAIACRILSFFHLPRHMLFSLKPYLTVTGNKYMFRRTLSGARSGFLFQRLQRKRYSCSLSIVFKSHLVNVSQSVWLGREHIHKRYVVVCKKPESNKISAKWLRMKTCFPSCLIFIIQQIYLIPTLLWKQYWKSSVTRMYF